MDAVVQLVRNAMCCVKDLQLFNNTFLYDPQFVAKFYTFPGPHMSKTTLLELLISFSQLYAALSCCRSGLNLIFKQGVFKLVRLSRVADLLAKHYETTDAASYVKKDEDGKKDDSATTKKLETLVRTNRVLYKSLTEEANSALKSTFIGICVFPIGLSFFWLFGNSLHLTEAGTIGGLPALIHALEVMELALVPLLYYMIKDGSAALQKARKIRTLVRKYGGKKTSDVIKSDQDWIRFETYNLIIDRDWAPFWSSAVNFIGDGNVSVQAEGKMLTKEVEKVEQNVTKTYHNDGIVLAKNDVEALEAMSKTSVLEGYREYLYFVFNFIAFYGYMLGIVVYYFDEEKDQSSLVRSLKLGYGNSDADWGGNFAGDLMWTVEPIVILASPYFVKKMIGAVVKAKQD